MSYFFIVSINKGRLLMASLCLFSGVPDTIRTCGHQFWNLMLYPAVIRGQVEILYTMNDHKASSELEQ